MLIPIRCFTCGKVTGNKWEAYLRLLSDQTTTAKSALDQLGLRRYCCRRILLCHVDLAGRILNFDSFVDPHPPLITKEARPIRERQVVTESVVPEKPLVIVKKGKGTKRKRDEGVDQQKWEYVGELDLGC